MAYHDEQILREMMRETMQATVAQIRAREAARDPTAGMMFGPQPLAGGMLFGAQPPTGTMFGAQSAVPQGGPFEAMYMVLPPGVTAEMHATAKAAFARANADPRAPEGAAAEVLGAGL